MQVIMLMLVNLYSRQDACFMQWLGRFLGIIVGWDPSVC